VDERKGSLLIEPLANGDAVVYPPVLGAEAEATEDHYIISGGATIVDADDPFPLIVNELEEHFGAATGGENIVVFINNAETALTKALTNVVEVPDRYIRVGDDTDVPAGLPGVPGRIIGRHTSGCWIAEWRWWPADYLFGIHLEEEPPLMERVDEAGTGIAQGLQLVSRDEMYPLEKATWRWRFGLGVANRLNGVVCEVDTVSYTIPTGYS
jgi:hypothetical protein